MKHKSERESYVYMPGLERGGAAGPVLLDDGRGVVLPGTGAGEGEVGLTRPSKPGMAELGMLKLSCFNCLPEPAAQGELRLRWARVGRSHHRPTSSTTHGQDDGFQRPLPCNSAAKRVKTITSVHKTCRASRCESRQINTLQSRDMPTAQAHCQEAYGQTQLGLLMHLSGAKHSLPPDQLTRTAHARP